MAFIHHTAEWIKGEIFEATLFGAFGLAVCLGALLFWKFGETPNSKAVVIPFVIVGLFFAATAVGNIASNKNRLENYEQAFRNDQKSFVLSEKKRVEEFQYLYKMTIGIAAVSFALAIGSFLFTRHSTLQAIGLALVLFGLTGLIIDFFSKERANTYYKSIQAEIIKSSS